MIGSTLQDLTLLRGSYDRQVALVRETPSAQREIAYFKENIGKVTSAEQFMKDDRLYRFVLEAFGLASLKELPPVEEFASRTGLGIEAVVAGRSLVIGSQAFLDEKGLERAAELEERARAAAESGTLVYVAVDGETKGSVELIEYLNDLAGSYGVGRTDMMEDRMLGLKVRENYEHPAATVLLNAHKALEGLVLTQEERSTKEGIDQQWSEKGYQGLVDAPLEPEAVGAHRSAEGAHLVERQAVLVGAGRIERLAEFEHERGPGTAAGIAHHLGDGDAEKGGRDEDVARRRAVLGRADHQGRRAVIDLLDDDDRIPHGPRAAHRDDPKAAQLVAERQPARTPHRRRGAGGGGDGEEQKGDGNSEPVNAAPSSTNSTTGRPNFGILMILMLSGAQRRRSMRHARLTLWSGTAPAPSGPPRRRASARPSWRGSNP